MNVIETKRLLLKTAYTERDGEAFLRMMKEEGVGYQAVLIGEGMDLEAMKKLANAL